MVRPFFLASLVLGMVAGGCSNTTGLDVNAGPFTFEVDTGRIAIPPAYSMNGDFPVVPCRTDAQCPALGAGLPAVRCSGAACTPEPIALELSGSVIDLSTYSSALGPLTNHLTLIEVQNVAYTATASALRTAVGPTEVFWGPESAATSTSDGVHALGQLPVLRFGPTGSLAGGVAIDPAGNAALSTYLLHTSTRFRLFARPTVTLTPGGSLPMGTAHLSIQMSLHVEGTIVQCDATTLCH